MEKLNEVRREIQIALSQATNPICAWSSGKDSQLLLFLIREIQNVPVVVFKDFWQDTTFVQRMVDEWDLTVFFYKPLEIELKQNGHLSIVSYYNVGQQKMPVITDVIGCNDKVCGLEWGQKAMKPEPQPYYTWDVTFSGSKQCDSHLLVPELNFDNLNTDVHKMITPLWGWTDGEVWEAINILGVPTDSRVYKDGNETTDVSNFSGCFACLTTSTQVFCPKQGKMIQGVN